ncbi:centrosomal protein of 78 kDa-like isoform X2 [Babylonia areolata]|uniref:centrosomal protein of 78 kDa-like isoform X2 n=1 Tax=Babylonia areolata TaxID=304850 RepID=UPI003FD37AC0
MIESVQARQRGAYDFESHYDNLCALQDSVPLAAVKANLSSGILDINADRVRAPDWPPIIHTLQINKSLEYVAIRSHFTPPSDADEKRATVIRRKTPSIRSKEITFRLCKALQSCLQVTPTLMFIELTGVPLRDRDINALMKGVMKNKTLVHLSFEMCRIGDKGVEMICKGLKGNNKITSINLTGCSLSARGAELIAKLIKHQSMKRHTEAWRDSLRYGVPQMDKMPGLRRVTLNTNPLLGNDGAQALAEALKDDLWVKALDLHGTGISTSGAKAFLEVLKFNTTIEVLDLRRNPLIDRSVLHTIMEHLMINCNGKETEFQWIEPAVEEEKTPSKPQRSRRKTTKVLNNSIGKKTTIKVTPGSGHRRSKSTSSVSRQDLLDSLKPTPGLPWRTAARANRYRGFPPERTPRKPIDELSEAETTSVLITREDSCVDQSLDTMVELKMMEEDRISTDVQKRREQEIRALHVELEQMRRMLKEEREERSKSDNRVMQLMMENRRLEDDLRIAKLRSASGQHAHEASMIHDDSVLDSIESSFKQFHAFLDMLREAGLGELITMAGLTEDQMSFSRSFLKSPNKSLANMSTIHGNRPSRGSHVQRSDNLRPGSAGSVRQAGGHTMGHINSTAYLKEKAEADEVYRRLLRQTSGAFTSGISVDPLPISPLTQLSGDLAVDPKATHATSSTTPQEEGEVTHTPPNVDSPSDPLSGRRMNPTPTQDSDKVLKGPEDEPSPRPVPTPRHRTAAGREEGKGDMADTPAERRAVSRTSEANYSMDSFEQSFVSEREEVVVIGDDADLLESPNSRPIMLDKT